MNDKYTIVLNDANTGTEYRRPDGTRIGSVTTELNAMLAVLRAIKRAALDLEANATAFPFGALPAELDELLDLAKAATTDAGGANVDPFARASRVAFVETTCADVCHVSEEEAAETGAPAGWSCGYYVDGKGEPELRFTEGHATWDDAVDEAIHLFNPEGRVS